VFVQEYLSKHFLRDYTKKREEKERGRTSVPGKNLLALFSPFHNAKESEKSFISSFIKRDSLSLL
jgi:hypothetical protein